MAAVVVALTGCQGGSGPERRPAPSIGAVLAATRAGGAGRVSGTAGTIKVRGSYTPAAQAATLRFPAHVGRSVFTVEARRIRASVYLARARADAATLARAGGGALLLRPASERRWVTIAVRPALAVVGPLDPVRALADLARERPTLHDAGTVTSGGVRAQRYRVTVAREDPSSVLAPVSPWSPPRGHGAQLDLVVDRRHRLLAWSATGTRRVALRVRYGGAQTVLPPPVDQVVIGSGPARPAQAFSTVRSGVARGVTWALERASGTLGTVCWRVRTEPPSRGAYGAAMDDGYCVEPPGADDTNVDLYQSFPYFPGPGAPLEIFVMLTPARVVTGATAQLVGGETAPATVLPDEGVVMYVGAPEAPVWGLTVSDGEGVHDCGPSVYDAAPAAPATAAEAIAQRTKIPPACLQRFTP